MAAVIPAPSAKGPRRQFKIERLLFSRFSCDIFQSRVAAPAAGLFAKRARPPFLLRFCVYSRDIPSRIIPNASLLCSTAIGFRVRDRPSFRRRLFPGLCPRRDRERIRKNEKRISLFSLHFLFHRYPLNEFLFYPHIHHFAWNILRSYGSGWLLFRVNIDRGYISSVVVFNNLFDNINDDTICIHLFSTTLVSGSSMKSWIYLILIIYHHLSSYLIRIGSVNIK